MDRYSILLNKKAPHSKGFKGIDISRQKSGTAASLWVKGKKFLIADSPEDVTVKVEGQTVAVHSVNGITGEVILENVPESGVDIIITYYYGQKEGERKEEYFSALPNTNYYVSHVPIVKNKTVPSIELRQVITSSQNDHININIEDIKGEIKAGSFLIADSQGRIHATTVTDSNVIGHVVEVNDFNNTAIVHLNSTNSNLPSTSEDDFPF